MSYKKRSEEEKAAIVRDHAAGMAINEICKKYSITTGSIYRLLSAARGIEPSRRDTQTKMRRLEKKLKEREEEIAILKEILKKI